MFPSNNKSIIKGHSEWRKVAGTVEKLSSEKEHSGERHAERERKRKSVWESERDREIIPTVNRFAKPMFFIQKGRRGGRMAA